MKKNLSMLILLVATLLVSACGNLHFKGASVGVSYQTPGTYGQPHYGQPYYGRTLIRIYPKGVNLHQSGGTRVYHGGHESPSTCYVDCFHRGIPGI